eukprot:gene8227-biopygen18109
MWCGNIPKSDGVGCFHQGMAASSGMNIMCCMGGMRQSSGGPPLTLLLLECSGRAGQRYVRRERTPRERNVESSNPSGACFCGALSSVEERPFRIREVEEASIPARHPGDPGSIPGGGFCPVSKRRRGLEPARAEPSGFRVHPFNRLGRSARLPQQQRPHGVAVAFRIPNPTTAV